MRQLTEAEREALIKVNVDNIDYDNIEGFIKAGFIAGLGHAQAKIEALEAQVRELSTLRILIIDERELDR